MSSLSTDVFELMVNINRNMARVYGQEGQHGKYNSSEILQGGGRPDVSNERAGETAQRPGGQPEVIG